MIYLNNAEHFEETQAFLLYVKETVQACLARMTRLLPQSGGGNAFEKIQKKLAGKTLEAAGHHARTGNRRFFPSDGVPGKPERAVPTMDWIGERGV